MLMSPTKILHFSQVHCIVNYFCLAATIISGCSFFWDFLVDTLIENRGRKNDHTGGQRYHRKYMSLHRRMALPSMSPKCWWLSTLLPTHSSATCSLLLAFATSASSPITFLVLVPAYRSSWDSGMGLLKSRFRMKEKGKKLFPLHNTFMDQY